MKTAVSILLLTHLATSAELPDRYFRLLDAGMAQIERLWTADRQLDWFKQEGKGDGWRLFPHTVLAAAVLYAKQDPANPRYHDPKMLALALRIGDLLATASERNVFEPRLNSDRDAYMWLDAYRLLSSELGDARCERWRQALFKSIEVLATEAAAKADLPGYQSPFIGTSPNHLSLWASTLHVAGKVFENRDWEKLGARIMHRFAVEEQSPEGFWGEHDRSYPTPGYDYTTYTGVALYYEWSHDPAALAALRRGLDFHEYFTYPNGWPADVLDDRNRYTVVTGWSRDGFDTWSEDNPAPAGNDESASKGQFGFSNFDDGRRYAEFLTGFFREGQVGYEDLGRLAQNALYYHRGPTARIPQDEERYSRRLALPAGIRKTGPWVVCLSGLISTQALDNQYYLDRQGHLSIFHEKAGVIVTGAGSKNQPELATFIETVGGRTINLPTSSRLVMNDQEDQLSLAYNTFFADVVVPTPAADALPFRFVVHAGEDVSEDARLTLQLYLKAGQTLETGAGKTYRLGRDRLELAPEDLGGRIRHNGWTLRCDPQARLLWPVYPYSPYAAKPETGLEHAVATLSAPVLRPARGEPRKHGPQEIAFLLEVGTPPGQSW